MPTTTVTITKKVPLPDEKHLARCEISPDVGPDILFFTGGTALKRVSQKIIRYTHNSIHLITPFDSGGSSAILRKAYHMPAVGDIRNRLMALADQTLRGNPAIYTLFAYRLPKDQEQGELKKQLWDLAEGKNPMIRDIPDPMRKIIRNHLHQFIDRMDENFDLRGASIGNLILTAGYLTNRRQLDPVIFIFSKLVNVRGVVRPTVNKNLHLAVKLQDGTTIIGQHNFTGKEAAPITSPVDKIWLTADLEDPEPVDVAIRKKIARLISKAELIVYPLGSFYSSVMANLLPLGVSEAVAENPCPKVFIPNLGKDPELYGHSLEMMLDRLTEALTRHDRSIDVAKVLKYILVDTSNDGYSFKIDKKAVQSRGMELIDFPMTTEESSPYLDAELLSKTLVSLT